MPFWLARLPTPFTSTLKYDFCFHPLGLLAKFEPFRGWTRVCLLTFVLKRHPAVVPQGMSFYPLLPLLNRSMLLSRGVLVCFTTTPVLAEPLTLALSNPGDLVGWAGLVRRHPCEWVTASTDLKLIAIPAASIERLERESDSFRAWLDRSSSPSEFIQV